MPVVARPSPRQYPYHPALVDTALYSVIVPAFALLLILILVHSKKHSRTSYAFITALAVLSVLVAPLGSHPQAKYVIQALLSLFLCIPVLHLTSFYNTTARPTLGRYQFGIRILLKLLLVLSLSSATLLVVLEPFLNSTSLPFAATFFLAFSTFALFLILSHIFCNRENPIKIYPINQRPIAINIRVATHSAAVPINLVRSSRSSTDLKYEAGLKADNFPTNIPEYKRQSFDSDISIISPLKPFDLVGHAESHIPFTVAEQGNHIPTRQLYLLLPLLLLAQIALGVSHSCTIIIVHQAATPSVIGIIQDSLKVAGIVATMKCYFLHACNYHLGSMSTPVQNSRYPSTSITTSLSSARAVQQTTIFPPIPPKSFAPHTSRVPSSRSRMRLSLDPSFNLNPTSASSRRSCQNERESNSGNDRLASSFSVGSMKSTRTNGSGASDLTRVEGYVGALIKGRSIDRLEYCNHQAINPAPRKLLGFDWLIGMTNRFREHRGEGVKFAMKSTIHSSLASTKGIQKFPIPFPKRREHRKLKKNSIIPSDFMSTSPPPSISAIASTCWNSDSTIWRMSSSDLGTNINMKAGNIGLATPVRTVSRKIKKKSLAYVSQKYGVHEGPNESQRQGKDGGKCGHSGYGLSSPCGLRLKKSFRLDDGRTLSPRLTLAAAIASEVRVPDTVGVNVCLVEGGPNNSGCEKADVSVEIRSPQVNGKMSVVTEIISEIDGKQEFRSAPQTSSEIGFSLTPRRGRDDFDKAKMRRDSLPRNLAPKPHPAPERSGEGPRRNYIEMNRRNVAQRPLEVSRELVLIPETYMKGTIQSTPDFITGMTTASTNPPSPASCSSTTTVSPLTSDRTPMIFRSSISDQTRPFPPQITDSPSSRIEPVRSKEYNVEVPTTPTRGSTLSSSSLRLSAATIGNVKNVISGIWPVKRNSKSGLQRSAASEIDRGSLESPTLGGVVVLEDDSDGDFTDLRDPFASPRLEKVRRAPSGGGSISVESSEVGHGEMSLGTGSGRKKMNTRGRIPFSPDGHRRTDSRQSENYLTISYSEGSPAGDVSRQANARHRKERRARKRIAKMPVLKVPVVVDDVFFNVEEALLAQRLWKRLDEDTRRGLEARR